MWSPVVFRRTLGQQILGYVIIIIITTTTIVATFQQQQQQLVIYSERKLRAYASN